MKESLSNKIVDWKTARERVSQWQTAGDRVVFTNGCFDLIHPGHVLYLQDAKNEGDRLVVGVNSDDSVRRIKGKQRPIQDEDSRATVLAALASTDLVVLFTEDTPLELIQNIRPDVLVKGGDWSVEQIVGGQEVISWGGQVKSIRFEEGHSTTNIINKILHHEG